MRQIVIVRDLVEAGEPVIDALPLVARERPRGGPVEVDDEGRDEERRTERLEPGRRLARRSQCRLSGAEIVQDDRQEAADELQPVPFEERSDGGRIVAEVAVGAGLRRDDPERAHLRQHRGRR